MDKRANSRKPFLFYNEEYYCKKPKQFFKSKNVNFESLNSYATNKTRCKELIVNLLDTCLPKSFRRKFKMYLFERLLRVVTTDNSNCQKDNQYLQNWLAKCISPDKDQQILFVIRQIAARITTTGVYNYYYFAFKLCFSYLLHNNHTDVYLKCLQIILKAISPVKNNGIIKTLYSFYGVKNLHMYIIENLGTLCANVNVMIKTRRLLIKHNMMVTEEIIKCELEKYYKKFDVPLREKLLLKYMMQLNNDRLQWPRVNVPNLTKSEAHKLLLYSNMKYNMNSKYIKLKNFNYIGWDENLNFRRTKKFCELTNIKIYKNNTKRLFDVKRKYKSRVQ
ncbi:p43 [Palpita vitrealis nucleopolyhedrovirus]|uniref:P43 n=1 Tax=Palpita vitrealis nucleopolyhedrovirus TaxID=2951960 RepID=A0AAE9RYV0_9ABAC|nr:p43 [Palpita vitrealis nucleopolyhedrovirus]